MSAQDELPPNWVIVSAGPGGGKWSAQDPCFQKHGRWPKTQEGKSRAIAHAWEKHGRTQAEDATMRAAVAQNVTWEVLIAAIQVYQCEDCKRLHSDDFMACEGCGSEASVGPLGSDDIISPWRAAVERCAGEREMRLWEKARADKAEAALATLEREYAALANTHSNAIERADKAEAALAKLRPKLTSAVVLSDEHRRGCEAAVERCAELEAEARRLEHLEVAYRDSVMYGRELAEACGNAKAALADMAAERDEAWAALVIASAERNQEAMRADGLMTQRDSAISKLAVATQRALREAE